MHPGYRSDWTPASAPPRWRGRLLPRGVRPPAAELAAMEAAGQPRIDGRERELEYHVHRILELLGEDPRRQGLRRTPHRVAESLLWLTRGYEQDPAEIVHGALFKAPGQSMVLVRDIELYSMCEHHMLPIIGRAHVAYLPDRYVIGLSKIARMVDLFARRLQIQERLTDQIAEALDEILRPHGVGVIIEAYHLCMMMRGVEKQNSKAITSALRGAFRDSEPTRSEFIRLAHHD